MKNYIPGYTGFKIKKKNEFNNQVNAPHSEIPGYSGYVWAKKSENIYGKTFGLMTNIVKCSDNYKNRPHLKDEIFSIHQESFKNPKNVDNSWNLVPTKKEYKIKNKYETDSDNILANELQNRIKISTKKPKVLNNPENSLNFRISTKSNQTNSRIKLNDPIIGYGGYIKNKVPNNIYGLDYQKANNFAKNYKNKDNFKENNYRKDFVKKSIIGYQGFLCRNTADNLYGKTFNNNKKNIKLSKEKLNYWKNKNL